MATKVIVTVSVRVEIDGASEAGEFSDRVGTEIADSCSVGESLTYLARGVIEHPDCVSWARRVDGVRRSLLS